jgi:hypothetical protein
MLLGVASYSALPAVAIRSVEVQLFTGSSSCSSVLRKRCAVIIIIDAFPTSPAHSPSTPNKVPVLF